MTEATDVLNQLKLAEKIALLRSSQFYETTGNEAAGIPPLHMQEMVTENPLLHPVDEAHAHTATVFPSLSTLANSWDADLLYDVGVTVGEQAVCAHKELVIGPSLAIKRSPLAGRNDDRFSEDPVLTGVLGTEMVRGIQSQGVGAVVRHFIGATQETRRLVHNAVMDKRVMRELYLAPYELLLKQITPAGVMLACNQVNEKNIGESAYLMQQVLRGEWGYDGVVMTDWGGSRNRVAGLKNGEDLVLPGQTTFHDQEVMQALATGQLAGEPVDRSAERLIRLAQRYGKQSATQPIDAITGHALAQHASERTIVLLKNDDQTLPLQAGQRVAVIGEFGRQPRLYEQASHVVSAWDGLVKAGMQLDFASGYDLKQHETVPELQQEAVQTAAKADVAIVFVGLPEDVVGPGIDRQHLGLPTCQDKLIDAVAETNPNTIVVVMTPGPVTMPWRFKVKSILYAGIGGEAGGAALAEVLIGAVNPSGKLAETFPYHDEDIPSFGRFGHKQYLGENYRESIYTGYRWYDSANVSVCFPFGYGLSYTTFAYDNLKVSGELETGYTVTVDVTNTGEHAGAEVVQLYLSRGNSEHVFRPVQELKAFAKVYLEVGETKTVTMALHKRDFAYWHIRRDAWAVESGRYIVSVARSSQQVELSHHLSVVGDGHDEDTGWTADVLPSYFAPKLTNYGVSFSPADEEFEILMRGPVPPTFRDPRLPLTVNCTLRDIGHRWVGKIIIRASQMALNQRFDGDDKRLRHAEKQRLWQTPIRALPLETGMNLNPKQLQGLVDAMNGHYFKGLRGLLQRSNDA